MSSFSGSGSPWRPIWLELDPLKPRQLLPQILPEAQREGEKYPGVFSNPPNLCHRPNSAGGQVSWKPGTWPASLNVPGVPSGAGKGERSIFKGTGMNPARQQPHSSVATKSTVSNRKGDKTGSNSTIYQQQNV